MKNDKTILVINGASASEQAPNFISVVVKDQIYRLECEKKSFERGAPERFPIYFNEFVRNGYLVANKIDLISIIIGPGSFTGLRASIAFSLGLQTGLHCPVVSLRRGEAIFPYIEKDYSGKLVWHMTLARRNRVFIETNQKSEIKAFDFVDIPWPEEEVILSGEAFPIIEPLIPTKVNWRKSSINEADAVMMAKIADHYDQDDKVTNKLYPLYIDPPKASLPAGGLRKAPK